VCRWGAIVLSNVNVRKRRPRATESRLRSCVPPRRQRVHVHSRLLSRHAEVVLADDIIAVEHAPGDVPRDGRGRRGRLSVLWGAQRFEAAAWASATLLGEGVKHSSRHRF